MYCKYIYIENVLKAQKLYKYNYLCQKINANEFMYVCFYVNIRIKNKVFI